MDNILQELFVILMTSKDNEEHLHTLEEVFQRLQSRGIRMKITKCYSCRSILGIEWTQVLINYYHKFLPNLATVVKPLNELLHKDKKWSWTPHCSQAMESVKQLLTTSRVLVHYDTALPIKLDADALQYRLGAVISRILPDGDEKPIAFASRTLSASEQNYSQIDKEALALIFGVQKFHTYLYGWKFTLVTNHKPLMSTLGPKKGVSSVAAARSQRWAILLQL